MREFTTILITLLIAFCMGIPAVYGSPTLMMDEIDRHACTDGMCGDCMNWSYPCSNWQYTCPSDCSGTRQSPINICCPTETATAYGFNLTSYTDPVEGIVIENDGYAVYGYCHSLSSRIIIDGGELPCKYTLSHIVFHWGCRDNRGSEHSINGKRYAMELQFVHYKSIYGKFSEALKHKEDSIAVLSVLFNVAGENGYLKPITDNLYHITKADTKKRISFNMGLLNLIPTPSKVYRYFGSRTTPPCTEVFLWYIFHKPLTLSKKQLNAFRMLMNKNDEKLCDNFRGFNPLNGREVRQIMN